MKNITELKSDLNHFTSTEAYHRCSRNLVLTDGALYLANNAECFWLFDIVDSIIGTEYTKNEDFLFVKVQKEKNNSCWVRIEDGNGERIYAQEIEYTDFPMDEYSFFVQKTSDMENNNFYVAMLTSEY